MPPSPEQVRDRAQITNLKPPVYDLDEPIWIAEDPETGCSGIGHVEAEAIGNLVSLVVTHETAAVDEREYVKLPGEAVEKRWGDGQSSVWDRLASLF